MPKFDKDVFKCLIDKVVIGEILEDGTINPYTIRFICKNGTEINCKDKFTNVSHKQAIKNTTTSDKQHSNNTATRENQHTLKGKPSRVNKRTKILSRFDVKIHRMNH